MAHTYHRYKPGSEPVAGYKVTICLGAGGFGEVWKGIGPGGTEVAIKIIDLTGQQGVQEFKSLGLVKKCVHPNLVPIHAFWLKDEDGNVVSHEAAEMSAGADVTVTSQFVKPVELIIVMGLGKKCLNKRLQEVRDDGLPGIPGSELLDYMDAAARGIDYLNTQVGIVHGDIKPHNILVVGDAAAVCDFGLARAVESLRKTSMAPMTVAYAAPESFRGKPTVKSDQYSLAITYIELRTGRMPFDEGLSPFDLMNTHVTGQLNLDRLPPYEREVIRRATALNPDDRWNNNRDFARALAKAFDADPQAKLLAGSPFHEDYEAQGFVATLKRDSRSSSLRSEFNRQTRENINRGVTPSAKTQIPQASLSGEAPAFAGPHSTTFDFSDANEAPVAPQSALAGKPVWILGAGVVVIAVLAGLANWGLFGGRTTLTPQQKLAAMVKDASPVIDRLTSQRQFEQALAEVDRNAQLLPADPEAQAWAKQTRERVRTVWLAMAEQAVRDNHVADATSYVREILIRFPNDPQATALLTNMTAKAETKTTPKTTPAANKFDMARIVRETDAQAQANRWLDALERLDLPPRNLSAEELQQYQAQAAKIRLQWVATARAYLDAGQIAAAQQNLSQILQRYPSLIEARVQLIRAHMAQSSFSLARAEWDKLQGIANLSPEAKQLRDALQLVIDLRTQKREAAAMYEELLKLTNLDTTPDPAAPWSLTSGERDLLKSTRDKLLDADYAKLAAAGRGIDQLPLADKLLAHLPSKQYELLLIKSEIQTDANQCDDARASLTAAEKALKQPTPAQIADHKARRTIVNLRDDNLAATERSALVAEAEKMQATWQAARRRDLGKVLVALTMKDRAQYEPIAMRVLLAAVQLEPQRADLYNLIKVIRGDEWNPRVARRLEDTSRPTPEQWRQLYDDCVALKVLTLWPDNRMRAICQAARAEAMCELGLKLDADALDVIELGNGWPAEGYIYYVGARVAWESSASADKVRALVGKAQNVRQKPVQLNAEFRQETIQKMQSGAAPAKRAINRLATPSKLLSTFKREQRRVFRLTAERDSQDEPDTAGVKTPASFDRAELIKRYEGASQLNVDGRIKLWREVGPVAFHLMRRDGDYSLGRIAVSCYEELAATARIEPAENFRRAIDAATQWIQGQPNAAAYTARARVYIRFTALRGSGLDHETVFKTDRFTIGDLCEADLTKAIKLAPKDPEPQRWLGRLKREQGDARGGDEIFAKAVDLAKAMSDEKLLLAALRDWAENQLLLEQVDEAHQRADQIARFERVPSMPDAQPFQKLASFIHGEAWFRLGKWSDAIAAYDQALPSEKLASATLDDLPLLMHRAEARHRLKPTDHESNLAAAQTALAELARAQALAADGLTQATIHAQASDFAISAVEALPMGDQRAAQIRQEGLDQAQAALALNATSQESVTVRLIQLKLLLHKLAALSPTAPERVSLQTQCRQLHAEAQRLALQTGLATELGELIRLVDRL